MARRAAPASWRAWPWRPPCCVVPPLALALGAAVYQVAVLLDVAGSGTGAWLAQQWEGGAAGGVRARRAAHPRPASRGRRAGGRRARRHRWPRCARAHRRRRGATLSGGVWWTVLGAPLTATPAIDYFITGPVGSAPRRRPRHAAPARGPEPALRGAAGRQPGPAWISRAADRRARPRRAAGPGVCAAGPRLAAPVLPAAADHRARPSFRRSRGPGRRGARPRARRRGRRADLAGGHRRAADRVCGRELLARRDASAHRSAGRAGPRARRSGQRRRAAGDRRHGGRGARRAARAQPPAQPRRGRGWASSSRRPKRPRCATRSTSRRRGSTRCSWCVRRTTR